MKSTDRIVLIGVGVFVTMIAFYLVMLSPKRHEAADLQTKVADLNSQIDQQRATAQFGKQARAAFPKTYARLVVLGKAVPADGDQASMMVELNRIASVNKVDFRSVALAETPSETAPPAPATSTESGATGATGPAPSSDATSSATGATGATGATAAPETGSAATSTGEPPPEPAPTEASTATLPIGASVGPAGLNVLPYNLTFEGNFFQIGSFVQDIENLTQTRHGLRVIVDGRLTTIDGFSLVEDTKGFPTLDASFSVSTFLAPPGQGLLGGATLSGPAPAPTTTTAPSSAVVAPPTAAVGP